MPPRARAGTASAAAGSATASNGRRRSSRLGNVLRSAESPPPTAAAIAIGFAAVSASRRLLAAILVGTALTAGVGIGVRLAACSRPCVSDLGRDFSNDGIRADALPYLDRNLEYPVGVGVVFLA